jgi:hypothetical protein
MPAKFDLTAFVVLATAVAMLVAVIVAPTASDAATFGPRAVHHRITEPAYCFASDRAAIADSGT